MAERSVRKDKKSKAHKGHVRSYKLMTFSEDEESIRSERYLDQKTENNYLNVDETYDKDIDNHGRDMEDVRTDADLNDEAVSVSENGSYDVSDLSQRKIAKRKSKGKEKNWGHDNHTVDDATENMSNVEREEEDDSFSQTTSRKIKMKKSTYRGGIIGKQRNNQSSSSSEGPEHMTDEINTPNIDFDDNTKIKSNIIENKADKKKSSLKKTKLRQVNENEDEITHDVTEDEKEEITDENENDGPVPLEKQVKFCQDRVTHVEKNYGAFCETLSSITRKIARMRDKGDLLSKQLIDYTDKETVCVSTKKNLTDFAHNLAAIQDYRDAEIHRLENKVIKPLTGYGPKCKKMKQVIKSEQSAIAREIKQRKNLEKIRDKKPGDAQSIAETELQKAAADAAIGSQGLQNQMKVFEKDRLTDIKRILADFVSVEMVFHAKAIEYYSQCFENLAMLDEEDDLEAFSRKLDIHQTARPSTLQLPPGMVVPQGTVTSLGSTVRSTTMEGTSDYTTGEYTTGEYTTGSSYTYTYGDSTTSSAEKRVRIQTGQSMYADVDDEDDDDDDDDDEDDDPQMYSKPIRRQ